MDARFELFVADIGRSVAFYREVLGFTEEQSYGNYHPLRRGSVTIGIGASKALKQGHYFMPEVEMQRRGLGVEFVLEVDDVNAEYDRAQKSGYSVAEPLQAQEWGLTDFRLADPDGYYLRITSRRA